MPDVEIQQQFHLLQKEIENSAAVAHDAKLNLLSTIDALRIEVEVLKLFITHYHPDFIRLYPKLKEQAMEEINPEWPNSEVQNKEK
jgi:hypothetical protein